MAAVKNSLGAFKNRLPGSSKVLGCSGLSFDYEKRLLLGEAMTHAMGFYLSTQLNGK